MHFRRLIAYESDGEQFTAAAPHLLHEHSTEAGRREHD